MTKVDKSLFPSFWHDFIAYILLHRVIVVHDSYPIACGTYFLPLNDNLDFWNLIWWTSWYF